MPHRNDRRKSASKAPNAIIHGRVASKKTIKKQLRNGKYSLKRLAEKGIHLDDIAMEIDNASKKNISKDKSLNENLFGKTEAGKQKDFMNIEPTCKGTILGAPPAL
ncbi:Pre-60S shuttling factor [Schizosaccharomyces pombe]|uniref:Uncharacterized protein C2D10.19c n=1 Tax=Schizosaccharomyces pombe (strain 972 / ATCC 24843) TaxID=284812 RepID=YGNJ_SCHPO|nr:uncharacterized protein SPBC2D10.19c [Schizosaccharomyces pombe]O74809.1 RecName: Full=Uncharacterized protein C2D10.19c [Schizosaccharomyces pombe 972h-]CAA21177.1 pre-60S shuttlingfactor (predicted) [Schizosaccharomyces pombe]|eukprot:NP_596238.1 uncharacterized protein SPBC2D10.19c [Schizosaccharomyces pombe]